MTRLFPRTASVRPRNSFHETTQKIKTLNRELVYSIFALAEINEITRRFLNVKNNKIFYEVYQLNNLCKNTKLQNVAPSTYYIPKSTGISYRRKTKLCVR